MKKMTFFLFIAVATFLQGCIIKSIHSFFSEGTVVFKQELVNTWFDSDGEKWEVTQVTQVNKKPNAYEMKYTKDGKEAVFLIHLFELNEELYVDFFPLSGELPVSGDDGAGFIFNAHLMPTHSVAKVELLSAEEVRIKWFNERWLTEMFKQNRIKISHEVIRDGDVEMYVLTASTDDLQKFILKYGHEERALDSDMQLVLTRKL